MSSRDHFNQHDDSINSQVHSLVDQFNTAVDESFKIDVKQIIENGRQKLEHWRDDYHRIIDLFYQEKCQELEHRCVEKFNKQQQKIDGIKAKINNLIF
jgi:uncharacterized protein YbcC (UPF0753/DUF2309 family)